MALEEQKTVVKGTFWGLAGNIAFKVISFIYLVACTRLFSQESIGLFQLGLGFVNILAIFGDLGLFVAFTRYIPYYLGKGEKRKAYALLKGAYWFVTFFSLLLTAGIFLSANAIAASSKNMGLAPVIEALSIYILFNSLLNLNSYAVLSMKKVREQWMLLNTQNVLRLALTFAMFLLIGSTALSLSWAYTLAFVFAALFSFWYVKKAIEQTGMPSDVSAREQFDALKEAVPFGMTLSLITTMWLLMASSDRIILGYLIDPAKAAGIIAIYAMATTLSAMLTVFTVPVSNIFLPLISELFGKGKNKEMVSTSEFATRWTLMLMVPAAILVLIFPGEILDLIYGSGYASGAAVLTIFTLGVFARGLSTVHSSVLAAIRRVKLELGIAAVAAALNIALNLVLVPIYGMEGAAIASAISLSVVSLLLFYYSKKLTGSTFLSGSAKPLAAALVAIAIFFLLRNELALAFTVPLPQLFSGLGGELLEKAVRFATLGIFFLLACAVYFAMLVLLRAFGKDDQALFSSALKRLGLEDSHVSMIEGIMGGAG